MDRTKAEAMLGEATAELATAESAVMYLRQVVNGLEGLLKTAPVTQPVFPHSPPLDGPTTTTTSRGDARSYPRTNEAVLEVLRAKPNLPMTFSQVWADLIARQLVDPAIKSGRNAYSNAVHRAVDDSSSPIQRTDDDRFVYATPRENNLPGIHAAMESGAEDAPHLRAAVISEGGGS